MPASPVRQTLKRETDPCHRRVDAAFSRFDLAEAGGLEAFLTAQAAAMGPLEDVLETASGGASALLPDWGERRRSHLLDGLGLRVPVLRAPAIEGTGALLGVLYVIEGSKLGARFLLNRVTGQGPLHDAAVAFLSAGKGAEGWATFLQTLDRHGASLDMAACVRGSMAAFELFERAATLMADQQDPSRSNLIQHPAVRLGGAQDGRRTPSEPDLRLEP